MSKTSAQKLTAKQRRAEAVKLRKYGLSFEAIGQELGITRQAACHTVNKALKELAEETTAEAAQLRALESERLDTLQMAIWDAATKGDLYSIDRVIKIMERRAKLFGLDLKPDEDQVLALTPMLILNRNG